MADLGAISLWIALALSSYAVLGSLLGKLRGVPAWYCPLGWNPGLLYGNGRDRKRRCLDALERVGLAGRVGHKPAELSGGEQQRVGIARALVKQPTLMLADEPTGNLDSHSSEEVVGILQRLNHQEGLTVVIVIHDPEVAACTRRIISMRDGLAISW